MIDLLGMQRAVWRSARTTTEKIVLLAIADFYSDPDARRTLQPRAHGGA